MIVNLKKNRNIISKKEIKLVRVVETFMRVEITHASTDHTRVCVKIKLCDWKSHSTCVNDTFPCWNHTLRVKNRLVRVEVPLYLYKSHSVCKNQTHASLNHICVCQNHTLLLKITFCVYKSHSCVLWSHLSVSKSHSCK
jgi:hypothetical protein